METAILVLIYIIGAVSGVLGLIYFLCKDDDRSIADQLRDIREADRTFEPTEHGRAPL